MKLKTKLIHFFLVSEETRAKFLQSEIRKLDKSAHLHELQRLEIFGQRQILENQLAFLRQKKEYDFLADLENNPDVDMLGYKTVEDEMTAIRQFGKLGKFKLIDPRKP